MQRVVQDYKGCKCYFLRLNRVVKGCKGQCKVGNGSAWLQRVSQVATGSTMVQRVEQGCTGQFNVAKGITMLKRVGQDCKEQYKVAMGSTSFLFNFAVSWWNCQQGLHEEQEEGGEAGDHSDGDVLPLLASNTAHPAPEVSSAISSYHTQYICSGNNTQDFQN